MLVCTVKPLALFFCRDCTLNPVDICEKRKKTYDSDVTVDILDTTVGAGDEELGLDQLLDRQDDTILDANTNGSSN